MKLLYCGFNGFGQCPSSTASVVSHIIELPLTSVNGASVSWSCMAVLSGTGVYLSGFVGGQSHQLKQLTLPDSQEALQVSCSRGHALVLVLSGECWRYCMKSGSWRRLDHFTMAERELEHKEDTGTDPIVMICCGSTFDVALSESGCAFVLPSPIYHPGVKVTQVACGNEHCLLLTETGQVFTWGRGSRGQLGHGDLESEQENARQVDSLAGLRVTVVAAGGWHSAAVTEWGDLYTWGWNHSGQLGFPMGENTGTCKQEQATGPKKLKTCNSHSTDEVTILNIPLPVVWPLEQEVNVKDVGCGSRHTVVLLDDSTVWGCGWNAYGQLGMPPEQVPSSWKLTRLVLPDGCPRTVTGVVCGAWSTIVVVT